MVDPGEPHVRTGPGEGLEPADVGAAPAPVWHALTARAALAALGSDGANGLTDAAADDRLATTGPNELAAAPPVPATVLLARQFTSPLIVILLAATLVTVLLREFADAAVIVAVLALNAIIGFTQEQRADRSVQALMSLASPSATVVRDGRRRRLDARGLVPGDVVVLEAGDRVPADLRLLSATMLRVDESLLTGESEASRKDPAAVTPDTLAADRTSMLHMGTAVVDGRALGVVVATGTATVLGEIAARMSAQERPPTPLQRRMGRFANVVAVVVLASTVLAFVLGVALGEAPGTMFLTVFALAVAVVPEGLPIAFTVAMALGVRRMARRQVIVRTLPAVETLGSTTVIGSDKTGTLTQNRMTVVAAWTAQGWFHLGDDVEQVGPDSESMAEQAGPGRRDPLTALLRTGVLANAADVRRVPAGPDGSTGPDVTDGADVSRSAFVSVGDPTETALLEAALRCGLQIDDVRDGAPLLLDLPFAAERRFSSVIVEEHGPVLRVKGAPEQVIARCTRIATGDGTAPIDAAAVLAAAEAMARRGLRVLAGASRVLERVPSEPDRDPRGLTLLGLIGMQDPPRHGVRDAVARCADAGIRVLMITGDHPATARAIATDLGISRPSIDGVEPAVVTGAEVERMDDASLDAAVACTAVFARVAPEHKLRIVLALQARGEVVAVTGDGVNDAPALKAADIGVAMGRDGTDVAREASDMVLTDDDFVSIVAAVEEGRVVFDNVRKVTYFLLSTGSASIVAIVGAIAAGLPLPYTPAALLWLNVVTNGLQDVALAFEPGEDGVLSRPTRSRHEGIVSRVLWERTVLTGGTMAAGSLWLFVWAVDGGLSPDAQRGVALTTFVVAMALHAFSARSEHRSIIALDPRTNPFLLSAVMGSLLVHVAALHWGPTQTLLRIAPFGSDAWIRMVGVALAVVAVSEIHKRLRSPTR
jgi:magnesium-transporting ATPase (P-type)